MHICEEEQAMIRQYNKRLANARGNPEKNNTAEPELRKETFSLFNLLS